MAKKSFLLSTANLVDHYFEDVSLFGIVAALRGYRLCWYLQQNFGFKFHLKAEILSFKTASQTVLMPVGGNHLSNVRTEDSYAIKFPVYEYHIARTPLRYFLYTNKMEDQYLLPDLKNVDFLLLIKGEGNENAQEFHQIASSIRNASEIQMFYEVDITRVKNKGYLIFE